VSRLLVPALLATALCSVGFASGATADARSPTPVAIDANERTASDDDSPLCPRGTLPDGDACVRLPSADDSAPDAPPAANAHFDKAGRWIVYDQIPRRPDRPADYDAYRYPIPPGIPGGHYVLSGYDLDKPDESQRRGATLSHVGHGGVDLPQRKGEPVRMVALDHQQGPSEVIYTGPLFGTTVLTRQTVREAGELRDYVLLYGHLDAIAPGVVKGKRLEEGDLVAFVGDTGSPELVHLHLEARRVRDGLDLARYDAGAIIRNEVTVVCDPRNVLPLK
jgi:murein DD-endopeptidase MepM/ murein hydrolase activator NlpD